MAVISLETLKLTTFDKTNKEHIIFLKELLKDKTILKRFQGLSVGLIHPNSNSFLNNGYYILDNDTLIGYLHISNFNSEEKSVYLRSAITSTKRNSGYGKRLLKEITNYLFQNYPFIANIRLVIASDNKPSLNIASSCGYTWLKDDIYINYNPHLENDYRRQK